jgi:hypothetical protein
MQQVKRKRADVSYSSEGSDIENGLREMKAINRNVFGIRF